jgi:NADPH2:quinone reductase
MSTYKAIQIEQTGGVDALKINDVPKPTPSPTQVLVKNEFVGVNFIDTYHRTGLYPLPLPATLGREAAGIVEAVGAEVKGISVGDRVVYLAAGSYGEYNVVERKHTFKLPESVSTKTAATIILQGLTALTMVQESYKIKQGDFILIHAAAGGTGQQLVRLAKHYGATVIGTTSNAEKAEIARKAGAHHIINYREEDVVKKVLELTENKGVHAVLDGVGKDTFDVSLGSVRRLGSLISFGNASGAVPPVTIARLAAKNVRLMRTQLFGFIETQEEFEHWSNELFNLFAQGVITEEIYKVYTFNDIKQAHTDLESGKTVGKLILTLSN